MKFIKKKIGTLKLIAIFAIAISLQLSAFSKLKPLIREDWQQLTA